MQNSQRAATVVGKGRAKVRALQPLVEGKTGGSQKKAMEEKERAPKQPSNQDLH